VISAYAPWAVSSAASVADIARESRDLLGVAVGGGHPDHPGAHRQCRGDGGRVQAADVLVERQGAVNADRRATPAARARPAVAS